MRQSTSGIDWDLGKAMFQRGETFAAISQAIGANPSTICRKARRYGWEKAADVLKEVAGVEPAEIGLQRNGNRKGNDIASNNDNAMATRSNGLQRVDSSDGLSSEERRERVKERIRADVERVLDALDAIEPHQLTTSQLLLREKTAEVVLKRANAVFEMDTEKKPIINIAVMAQLPNEVPIAATMAEG